MIFMLLLFYPWLRPKMSMTNDEDGAAPKTADAILEEPRMNDK